MSSTRLTSRVARGSIWSLSGQSATLLASLISTPFVIRLLGAEGYGVLALVNLTFAYMAFADVGMGVASTRFASNCQGGESEEEVAIVWTSLLIVSIPSLLAAALFAWQRAPSWPRRSRVSSIHRSLRVFAWVRSRSSIVGRTWHKC